MMRERAAMVGTGMHACVFSGLQMVTGMRFLVFPFSFRRIFDIMPGVVGIAG